MWYEARDFFGKSSIGYAVSINGRDWQTFPGNPVLQPEDLGLTYIGSPVVHLQPDGRLRMWVTGIPVGDERRSIYELRNDGVVFDAEE
jgi:hypothetical protein